MVVIGMVVFLMGVIYGVVWWRWPTASPLGGGKRQGVGYLEKYDFDSLRKRGGKVSRLVILGDLLGVEKRRKYEIDFSSERFSFESERKKITGMINILLGPESKKMPAVIMLRGYADKVGYYSGSGSWRMADKLAEAGIITVSIDWLGFGGSDGESLDMLEARFEKVPAVMDLVASVKAMEIVDEDRVGIWAHSNGGQIALSVLEILGENIPTVLWAPMTNPFPESVLETASEMDDGGKAVIGAIDEFERNYDIRRYAFENYYDWIEAPVVIHQGTGDYWCKLEWQEEVRDRMMELGKEIKLYVWLKDDHNLSRNWEEIVERDIEFYRGRFGGL